MIVILPLARNRISFVLLLPKPYIAQRPPNSKYLHRVYSCLYVFSTFNSVDYSTKPLTNLLNTWYYCACYIILTSILYCKS